MGWKSVYYFLCNDEKTCRNHYLFSLKNIIVEKKSDIFLCSVSKQKPCDYPPCYSLLMNEMVTPMLPRIDEIQNFTYRHKFR